MQTALGTKAARAWVAMIRQGDFDTANSVMVLFLSVAEDSDLDSFRDTSRALAPGWFGPDGIPDPERMKREIIPLLTPDAEPSPESREIGEAALARILRGSQPPRV